MLIILKVAVKFLFIGEFIISCFYQKSTYWHRGVCLSWYKSAKQKKTPQGCLFRFGDPWENLPRPARLPTRKRRGRDSNSAPYAMRYGAKLAWPQSRQNKKDTTRVSSIKLFFVNIKRDEIFSSLLIRPCPARYSVLYLFIFRVVISEVFTNMKVKLRRSEVCAPHKWS